MLARLRRYLVRPHLARRTVRLRLTAVYGALFLVCGAALLGVTYVLVEHATAGNFSYTNSVGADVSGHINGGPGPQSPATAGQLNARDSDGTKQQTLTAQQMQSIEREARALASSQHAHLLHQLLVYSGIALAVTTVAAVAFGWFVAGRVLRPLRTITDTANEISATNLHERLALTGPKDELRNLGDTFDKLLARLEGAFDAQRRFVANASHELRTPLTVMRALLQMTLSDPNATIESYRSTCLEVLAAGEDQERLIEALLVLARSERGLDHRERVDLAAVIDGVLVALAPKAAGLRLHLDVSTQPALIDGDNRLAERLVANLIDNAIRHNVPDGRVVVSSHSDADGAVVSVSNTGRQIPAGEVERLLRPFERLAPANTRRDDDGLGLGLSIVSAIAAAHDARLTARARPHGGLEIEVRFPSPVCQPAYRRSADAARGEPRDASGLLAAAVHG